MPRQIKGVIKNYQVSGSDRKGYRPVWDMGKATYRKRVQRVDGVNRPSI